MKFECDIPTNSESGRDEQSSRFGPITTKTELLCGVEHGRHNKYKICCPLPQPPRPPLTIDAFKHNDCTAFDMFELEIHLFDENAW